MAEYGALVERIRQETDLSECHFVHHKLLPYTIKQTNTMQLGSDLYYCTS